MTTRGSIRRHGSGYEARVTINGEAFSGTFSDREEAEAYLSTVVSEHADMMEQPGYVYFVGGHGVDLIKIGFSDKPDVRIRDLQVGSPVRLHLLGTVASARKYEHHMHKWLAEERRHGEWFLLSPRVQRLVTMAQEGRTMAALLDALEGDAESVPVRIDQACRRRVARLSASQTGRVVTALRSASIIGLSMDDVGALADCLSAVVQSTRDFELCAEDAE